MTFALSGQTYRRAMSGISNEGAQFGELGGKEKVAF